MTARKDVISKRQVKGIKADIAHFRTLITELRTQDSSVFRAEHEASILRLVRQNFGDTTAPVLNFRDYFYGGALTEGAYASRTDVGEFDYQTSRLRIEMVRMRMAYAMDMSDPAAVRRAMPTGNAENLWKEFYELPAEVKKQRVDNPFGYAGFIIDKLEKGYNQLGDFHTRMLIDLGVMRQNPGDGVASVFDNPSSFLYGEADSLQAAFVNDATNDVDFLRHADGSIVTKDIVVKEGEPPLSVPVINDAHKQAFIDGLMDDMTNRWNNENAATHDTKLKRWGLFGHVNDETSFWDYALFNAPTDSASRRPRMQRLQADLVPEIMGIIFRDDNKYSSAYTTYIENVLNRDWRTNIIQYATGGRIDHRTYDMGGKDADGNPTDGRLLNPMGTRISYFTPEDNSILAQIPIINLIPKIGYLDGTLFSAAGRLFRFSYRLAGNDILPSYVRGISSTRWDPASFRSVRYGAHALNIGANTALFATTGYIGPFHAVAHGLYSLTFGSSSAQAATTSSNSITTATATATTQAIEVNMENAEFKRAMTALRSGKHVEKLLGHLLGTEPASGADNVKKIRIRAATIITADDDYRDEKLVLNATNQGHLKRAVEQAVVEDYIALGLGNFYNRSDEYVGDANTMWSDGEDPRAHPTFRKMVELALNESQYNRTVFDPENGQLNFEHGWDLFNQAQVEKLDQEHAVFLIGDSYSDVFALQKMAQRRNPPALCFFA